MERLTEKHYLGTDHYMKCSGNCNVDMDCIDCPSFDRLVERLAAYEDTHMMPSDVTSMRMDMAIIAALFNGVDVDRMKELAEADKDGRLVVLPCKVGTATYYIHYPIAVYPDESEPEIKRGIFTLCDLDRVGHSVFLTREEAEKALEAMK